MGELDESWRPFIALEVGGEPLDSFTFPETGTLLVGSEELGLSSAARDAADYTVSVGMAGVKGSLNVSVACGIALHTWFVQARMTDQGDRTW
jgi:TrmH family RNA methyltransferase